MIVRHKLLADLVRLWKNDQLVEKIDRLPIELSPRKSKPLGRCCVHKERAVWRYKTFPLMGHQLTQPVMPSDTVALADATGKAGVYSVQNTGSVAAYVRVTVTKYWADEENNGKRTDLDGSAIQVSAPAGSGWLESNPPFSSGETQTFYFCRPISPQEASEALLQSLAVDAALGNEYTDKTIRLEAVAEGVQFAGAAHGDVNQKGILTSWGVLAQLDEDGNITAIEQ